MLLSNVIQQLYLIVSNIKYTVELLQYGLSPFTLNPFQFNLEFGTTHRVQMCYTSKQV